MDANLTFFWYYPSMLLTRQRVTNLVIFVLLFLASGSRPSAVRGEHNHLTPSKRFRPGTLLVGFDPAATQAQKDLTITSRGLTPRARLPQLEVVELAVPEGRELALAVELAHDPGVRFAEPDYVAHAAADPNDPRWSEQWGPQRIGASRAWDRVRDVRGLVIAVLDTGVAIDHPDLRQCIWTNPGEIPNNRIDDDRNGKVDDVNGWHFFHTCNDWGSCEAGENNNTRDDNGHGTRVSGIVAAESNNGIGITGLAWRAPILPLKALDKYGDGWYSDIASAIVYATDNGAAIINLSLGGIDPSETLRLAINYALDHNRLVVAASGNDQGAIHYPAAYDGVIAVGASDRNDQRASFSNTGPELDLVAPGVNILSTSLNPAGYATDSGTSFAAPHVAGVAALVWAANPALTAAQVRGILEQTAVDLGPVGRDDDYGYGRIDAGAAVDRALDTLPTSPTPTSTTTPTRTASPTATPTSSWTPISTLAPRPTFTPSSTPSPTPTNTASFTPPPTATRTLVPPTATSTPLPTVTATESPQPTVTPSRPACCRQTVYLPFLAVGPAR